MAGLVGAVKDRFEQVMGPIRGRGRAWAKEKADDRLSDRVRSFADVVLSIGARLELIRQAATIRGLGIAGAWSVGQDSRFQCSLSRTATANTPWHCS